jgi:hypothetical protein
MANLSIYKILSVLVSVSSTLLDSPDFIAFIKDKFLSGKKPDKEMPALKVYSYFFTFSPLFVLQLKTVAFLV